MNYTGYAKSAEVRSNKPNRNDVDDGGRDIPGDVNQISADSLEDVAKSRGSVRKGTNRGCGCRRYANWARMRGHVSRKTDARDARWGARMRLCVETRGAAAAAGILSGAVACVLRCRSGCATIRVGLHHLPGLGRSPH
ncbi:hypothetical protein KCP74_11435 [Salmonella enterica subsp. enterica]|nr:hypothetical protein KCP74_11435 [Salmonella enterica subsp. enterica]